MPPTCTVCRHPARMAIDTALAQLTPLRTLAATYGVSYGALQRHSGHRGAVPAPMIHNVPSVIHNGEQGAFSMATTPAPADRSVIVQLLKSYKQCNRGEKICVSEALARDLVREDLAVIVRPMPPTAPHVADSTAPRSAR